MSEPQDQVFGFSDVDEMQEAERLLAAMDATAAWPAVRELHEWASPHLQAGEVLDVGSGQGSALLNLAEVRSGRFVGVDVSDLMLDAARERAASAGLDVTFLEASAIDLPFPDDDFDVVRCERVLQWLDDPQPAVDEMVRVLRPGGRILLLDTDWRSFGTTVEPELEAEIFSPPVVWPSPEAGGFLRRYLLAAGVTDIELKSAAHHATSWAENTSDGMIPADGLREFKIASGIAPTRIDEYIEALRFQAAAGTLSMMLTMWGATGTTVSPG